MLKDVHSKTFLTNFMNTKIKKIVETWKWFMLKGPNIVA